MRTVIGRGINERIAEEIKPRMKDDNVTHMEGNEGDHDEHSNNKVRISNKKPKA